MMGGGCAWYNEPLEEKVDGGDSAEDEPKERAA
jgi:hypothetical protein